MKKYKGEDIKMKKLLGITVIIMLVIVMFSGLNNKSYAEVKANDVQGQSHLIQIKEKQAKSIEEYKQKYGSDTYGFTAYILHAVQIYSIPFCFLGIVVSTLYRVVLGVRNLENAEKGLGMTVAVVTITIICQVLPLIFAIVVKSGKE